MKNGLFIFLNILFVINAHSQTIIWTGNGDGLSWSDPTNWNTGSLPGSSDDVLISVTDPLKDSVSFTLSTVTIKSLVIGQNNYLRISAGTTFIISFSSGISCDLQEGNLINRGNFYIEDAGTDAIVIGAGYSLDNFGFGLIQTDRITGSGIKNLGSMRNTINAIIDLRTCHVDFINNELNFINSGTLKTHYYANAQAFRNTGYFKNTGLYYHDGSLNTLLVTDQGYVENQGEFSFVGTQVYSLQIIGNDAKFENTSTGQMTLNGQIQVKDGGTLINKNYLKNSAAVALSLEGDSATFINDDSLYIFKTGFKAIDMKKNSFFLNNGTLIVDSLNSPFEQLIRVDSSTFVNNGTVTMDLAHKATALLIINNGLFENNASVQISNLGHDSGSGVINYVYGIHISSGKLFQSENAELILDSLTATTTYYYAIGNFDSLVNNGNLYLRKMPKAIRNYGGYIENDGTIDIRKINEVAYGDLAGSEMINKGDFYIRNSPTAQNTLMNIQGYFANLGQLQFINVGTTNRSIWSTGDFYNDGLIELDTTYNGEFSVTGGKFINDSCGVINSGVRFEIAFNEFTPYDSAVNYGVIQILYENPYTFVSTIAALINRGLFLNTSGFINLDGTNSGYESRYLSGTMSAGVAEKPIFFSEGSSFLLSTQFFFDSLQNNLAGTFMDNALTASKDTSGTFPLYFSTKHKPSCPIKKFKLKWNETSACSAIMTNTFISNESHDWFLDANWDLSKVPDYCSNVVIPADKKVIVSSPMHAKANKIETLSGAVLEIQSGVLLEAANQN